MLVDTVGKPGDVLPVNERTLELAAVDTAGAPNLSQVHCGGGALFYRNPAVLDERPLSLLQQSILRLWRLRRCQRLASCARASCTAILWLFRDRAFGSHGPLRVLNSPRTLLVSSVSVGLPLHLSRSSYQAVACVRVCDPDLCDVGIGLDGEQRGRARADFARG
jgi:hypothetical protein